MTLTHPHTDRISLTIGWLSITVWCVAWWIIYQYVPLPGLDDIFFGLANADWMKGESDHINWQGVFDTINITYNTDNARLANTTMIFLILLPRWLRALIATGFMFLFVWQAIRLTGSSTGHSALPAVFIVLLLRMFMPWREQFESIDFAMNYVVPSVFVMGVYLSLLRHTDRRHLWGEAILAILIGFWHEGIAVPFAASMAILSLIDKRLRRRCLLLFLLTLPGMLFMWNSPAMRSRMDIRAHYTYRLENLIRLSKLHPMAVLAIFGYAGSLVIKPLRAVLGRADLTFIGACCAAIVTSLLMQGEVPDNLRVGWISDMLGCVMVVRMAVSLTSALPSVRWKHIAANFMALIFMIPLTVSLAASAGVALYQRKAEKELLPLIKQSTDGQVYYDVLRYWQMPPASLGSPFPEFYLDPYFEYHTGIKKDARIVPTCFKQLPEVKGEKMPGNNPFYHMGEYIYAPAADYDPEDMFWNVEFGNGSRMIAMTECPFTDKEGNKYYMVWPHRSYWGMRSGINAINKQ